MHWGVGVSKLLSSARHRFAEGEASLSGCAVLHLEAKRLSAFACFAYVSSPKDVQDSPESRG